MRKIGLNKLGQEEMVGFVVIVIIVAIIGAVFIGFSLNRGAKQEITSSSEVKQFLESALEYTGNCSIGSEGSDREIKRNIASCASNPESECTSGENVCTSVKNSVLGEIETSYKIGNETALRGYQFRTVLVGSTNKTILNMSKGDCSRNYRENEIPLPYNLNTRGNIIRVSFRLCS